MAETKTETDHRWFEYGRWFYGWPSSFEDHRHNEDGAKCEFRTRTITVGDWSEWTSDRG